MISSRPGEAPSSPPRAVPDDPPGVQIGPSRLHELPAIARLQRSAFPPRLAYPLVTLAILHAAPWVRLLVARRHDAVVGCVIGDRVAEGARIINLAVAPEARRQGIGAALLHALSQSLPGGDMVLMVQVENTAAQALYSREGFAAETHLPHYYGPNRPGIWMRKRRTGVMGDG